MNSVRVIDLFCRLLADPKGIALSDYCTLYGVTRRTAFRDMATLRKAGLPIAYDRDDAHWKLTHSLARLPHPDGLWPLTWGETVLLIASVLRFTENSHRESDGARVIEQLKTLIAGTFTDQLGSIMVNARLLAAKPTLPFERAHGLVNRFSRGQPTCISL